MRVGYRLKCWIWGNNYYQILLNEGKYTLNENGACVLKTVSTTNYYGMTKEQFTFLMSLTGSLCGFTFLFFCLILLRNSF